MVPVPAYGAETPVWILFFDDEALIRLLAADALRDAGFTVIEASHAEEALTYIASGAAVDLVFTDVQMPGPIDGLGLARQLRARSPSIPVIITSGNLRAPPDGLPGIFVPKPYDTDRVIALIVDALGRDPSRKPND